MVSPDLIQVDFSLIESLAYYMNLDSNEMSPFYNKFNGKPKKLDKNAEEYFNSEEGYEILEFLFFPDKKIQYKTGNKEGVMDEFETLFIENNDKVVVLMPNRSDEYVILSFRNKDAYAEWWTDMYCIEANNEVHEKSVEENQQGNNIYSSAKNTSELVALLHLMDIYKRMHLESMLNYSTKQYTSLFADAYKETFNLSKDSGDIRWSLASFFQMIPYIKEFLPEDITSLIRFLEENGWIRIWKKEGVDKDIISLKEKAIIAAKEFMEMWQGFIGVRLYAFNGERINIISRQCIIPTAKTNNLLYIYPNNKGEMSINNKTLNKKDFLEMKKQWLEAIN